MVKIKGKVLYHWKNPALRQDRCINNEAKEFIVEECKEASSGVVIWGKFNGEWSCNPWSCRALIRQLTEENKKLQTKLDRYRWIPVGERLPELFKVPHPHSEEVWIAGVALPNPPHTGWFERERGWRYGDGTVEIFPSHWMPIIPLDEKEKNV